MSECGVCQSAVRVRVRRPSGAGQLALAKNVVAWENTHTKEQKGEGRCGSMASVPCVQLRADRLTFSTDGQFADDHANVRCALAAGEGVLSLSGSSGAPVVLRGLASPTSASAAVSVGYSTWKAPVRFVTTAPLSVTSPATGVLTAVATGPLTVDASTAEIGDRVLVAGQSSAWQNGIYVVAAAGAVGGDEPDEQLSSLSQHYDWGRLGNIFSEVTDQVKAFLKDNDLSYGKIKSPRAELQCMHNARTPHLAMNASSVYKVVHSEYATRMGRRHVGFEYAVVAAIQGGLITLYA